MAANARVLDLWAGICVCHNPPVGMAGIIVTGSGITYTDGRNQARFGDITIGFCGHAGVIVGSSGNSYADGRGVARQGDPVAGCNIGVIVTGSGNTDSL